MKLYPCVGREIARLGWERFLSTWILLITIYSPYSFAMCNKISGDPSQFPQIPNQSQPPSLTTSVPQWCSNISSPLFAAMTSGGGLPLYLAALLCRGGAALSVCLQTSSPVHPVLGRWPPTPQYTPGQHMLSLSVELLPPPSHCIHIPRAG